MDKSNMELELYVMLDDGGKLKVKKIINKIDDDVLIDVDGNKHYFTKIKYIWKDGYPIANPEYIQKYLLEEKCLH